MIRALFLAANSSTRTRLQLDRDVREISQRLRASRQEGQIQIITELAARPADLQAALLRTRPEIIHFSGHGSADEGISFEDESGKPVRVAEQALAHLFQVVGRDVRLVYLDACYTASQAEALLPHVDAVIGVASSIGDVEAQSFAAAFYQAIGFGMPLDTAFALARNSLALAGLAHYDAPALLVRAGVDPAQMSFLEEPASVLPPSAPVSQDALRFLQEAGFSVGSAREEANGLTCVPRSPIWQRRLGGEVYARIVAPRALDGNEVIRIREAARRRAPTSRIAFAIVDKAVDDAAWLQIAALRPARFHLVPIPHALILDAFAKGEPAVEVLARHLDRFLERHADPYNVRHPVFDVLNFFGREPLAAEIGGLLDAGQPVGLFGLRKIGKSSLLSYLRCTLPYPTALVDLQAGGGLGDLYGRVLEAWNEDAQTRLGLDLGIGEAQMRGADPSEEFLRGAKDALSRLLIKTPQMRLALLLDEIERLVPEPGASGEDLRRYLAFTGALRSLVQERYPLSIAIAGVDPAVNRFSRFRAAGEQNPFYALLHEIQVPPLIEADCLQMVRNIGRQVDISYGEEAVVRVARASGGHPYLARQLCSLAYARRNREPGEVLAEEISAAEDEFLYDARYVVAIDDNGLWHELTRGPLWSEEACRVNEALLIELAQAEGPVPVARLADGALGARRRAALAALAQLSVIRRAPGEAYVHSFGLFRAWIRRVLLGLKG